MKVGCGGFARGFGRACGLIGAAAMLATAYASAAGAQVSEPAATARELLGQYKSALARIERVYSRIRCDVRNEYRNPDVAATSEPSGVSEYTIRLDGGAKVFVSRQLSRPSSGPMSGAVRDSEPFERILGQNDRYSFQLRTEKEGGARVIRDVGRVRQKPLDEDINELFNLSVGAAYSMAGGQRMSDVLGYKSFRLQGAERLNREGRETVRFDFDFYPRDLSPRENEPAYVSMIEVDPSRGWVIIRSEMKVGPKPEHVMRTSVEYAPEPHDGVALPVRIASESPSGRSVEVVSNLRIGEVAASEFTLTHFGFPELAWDEASPRQFDAVIWLIGAAAIFAVVGAILLRKARRTRMS